MLQRSLGLGTLLRAIPQVAVALRQVRYSKDYDKLSRSIVENAVLDKKIDSYGEELFYRLRGRRKFWKFNYQKLHAEVFDWPSEYGFMRVRNLLRERLKGEELMDIALQKVSDPMMLNFKTFA